MLGAITGDIGSGKTNYGVNKLVYRDWKNGVNIYSNTLLFFEDKRNRHSSSIDKQPQHFSKYERLKWWIKSKLLPIFNKVFNLSQGEYTPQDLYFWHRNKELIKDYLYNKFTIPYSRGSITYFSDISEISGARLGLIFIDEGSSVMDARNWEMLPDEFANEIRQSRKNGLDLIVTTQEMGQIDKNYRRLVQYWIECSPTWLCLLHDPVIVGRFRAEYKRPGDFVKTETANTESVELEILEKKKWWITIFKRRRYDTNFNVGFSSLKVVNLINIKGDYQKAIWAIVPKKTTYKEIQMDIKVFHQPKLTR